MTSWIDEFPARIAALDDAHLRRQRRAVVPAEGAHLRVDGAPMLAFCSNDYLGLAAHPALAEAACAGTREFGVGSGGSPLVSGHSLANAALEDDLARFVQLPRALYFYAGYATNIGIVPALVGAGDALFSDALNHACLIDGARLSRATVHRYPHADLAALDALLAASPARRKLVITDAVFSMDGDVADVRALHTLCERHDALLLIDDAHGFGVLGPEGRGTLAEAGLVGANASPRVLYMATLGKAAGVAGAFVAGPDALVEWLVQKTRSYIFATAAPALLAHAAGQPARDRRRGLAARTARRAHCPAARRPGAAGAGHALAARRLAHRRPGPGHRRQRRSPGRDGRPARTRPVGARHPPAHGARGHGAAAHRAVGGAYRGRCAAPAAGIGRTAPGAHLIFPPGGFPCPT